MRLARKSRPGGDVDVSSFSDLAFLLIIFFILTTTFTKDMGAKIAIPSGTSNPESKPEKDAPTVSLSTENILFNEDKVTLDELREKLKAMRLPEREENRRIIVLESAHDVRFEHYYEVVTAISRAGGVLALIEQIEEKK